MTRIENKTECALRPPTVYGVLLNTRATHVRMRKAFHEEPYKVPPDAPVLYIKPVNTHARSGSEICIPIEPGSVDVNATIALVMGSGATRLTPLEAMDHVSGLRIACDLSLPHESVYRPAVRQRCRDGFLPMSDVMALPEGRAVEQLVVVTYVNDVEVSRHAFGDLVRGPAQLLAEVTAFMSLDIGDLLLIGVADRSPQARVGDKVRVEVEDLGSLFFALVEEDAKDKKK